MQQQFRHLYLWRAIEAGLLVSVHHILMATSNGRPEGCKGLTTCRIYHQRGRQTAGQVGFGLGLAIGRELAARMGGELALDDQDCPGARFTLRLPIAHAPDMQPVAVS